uniref:Uncharacterized protein n=1 Tax=Arundo donax TaxID=35708 RepID=A0A0A8ZKE0_ARUDO
MFTVSKCRHPGLLHEVFGVAFEAQAATSRTLTYPLSEIAAASCLT